MYVHYYYYNTLGPAYNEFGYNGHPAITSNFLHQKKIISD